MVGRNSELVVKRNYSNCYLDGLELSPRLITYKQMIFVNQNEGSIPSFGSNTI